MKNLFIILLLILVGYLLYPTYQLKKAEYEVKTMLQNIDIEQLLLEDKNDKIWSSILGLLLKIETKNNYPKYEVKITIEDVKILLDISPIILKTTVEHQKDYLCDKMTELLRKQSKIHQKAMVNILHKDKVYLYISFLGKDNKKMVEYNQEIIGCLNYTGL